MQVRTRWRSGKEYASDLDVEITVEDEALVNNSVAMHHPFTLAYNDPSYPLNGR